MFFRGGIEEGDQKERHINVVQVHCKRLTGLYVIISEDYSYPDKTEYKL